MLLPSPSFTCQYAGCSLCNVTFSVNSSQRSGVKLFHTQPVFHLAVLQPLCSRAGLCSFGSHCYTYVTEEHSSVQAKVADIGPHISSVEERNLQHWWDDGLSSRVQRPHPMTPHKRKIRRRRRREEREPWP